MRTKDLKYTLAGQNIQQWAAEENGIAWTHTEKW